MASPAYTERDDLIMDETSQPENSVEKQEHGGKTKRETLKELDRTCWGSIFWMSGAAVLGWVGHTEWHNEYQAECLYNQTAFYSTYGAHGDMTGAVDDISVSRPDDCFGVLDDLSYMALGIAIALGVMLFFGKQTNRGIKGPFPSATWEMFQRNADGSGFEISINLFSGKVDDMTDHFPSHVRRWAEFFHMVFAIGVFVVWQMVTGNGVTGVRVGSELPYLRHLFFLWIIVVPTLASSITKMEINHIPSGSKEERRRNALYVHDYDMDIMSLAYKTLAYIVLAVFVDPQTQFMYPHSDDSGEQKVVVWTLTICTALAVVWFLCNYTVERKRRGLDMLFAFNDFPVYITLSAAYAWSLTARLADIHRHPFTLNYDFFIHMVYLWAALIGITCTPNIYTLMGVDNPTSQGMLVQNPTKSKFKSKKASFEI